MAHPRVHHIVAALHRNSPLSLIDLGESGHPAVLPLLRVITEISSAQGTVFELLVRLADLFEAIATNSGRYNTKDLASNINIPRPSASAVIHAMITNLDHTLAVQISPAQSRCHHLSSHGS